MFFELLLILLLIIAGSIIYARWHYGILDGLGFPVMKPSFFLGSDPELFNKVQHFEDAKRYKKFGPVWGYYEGRTPIVFIADPELIKSIFVKDIDHFYDRAHKELGDPILNEILDFIPGAKWKAMRATQTKFLSITKLKQQNTLVFNQAMDSFKSKLEADIKASGKGRIKIDARDRLCAYILDVMGRSLFSTTIDADRDARLLNACKRVIGVGQEITRFYVWTMVFPWLSKFAPTLVLDPIVTDTLVNFVKTRSQSEMTYGDYGDVLVSGFKLLKTPEYQKLKITRTTLLGQATNLFLAGFDGPSALITFLAYHLALEPTIQDRVVSDIRAAIGYNADLEDLPPFEYETIQKMEYLNACMMEIVRLYPVLIRPERICTKDWEDPVRGIKIPKGVVVMMAGWAVNRDPQNFENPEEFIPDRFLGENKSKHHPYSSVTFGFGHRACIGMRFALEAMKVGMARLLLKYRLETRDDTVLKYKTGLNFVLQFEPLFLNVVERGNSGK